MDKRRRRKHRSQKRALVVGNEHRTFLEATPSGTAAVADLEGFVADGATQIAEQDRAGSDQQAATIRCRQARRLLAHSVKLLAAVSSRVTLPDGESAQLDGTPVRK